MPAKLITGEVLYALLLAANPDLAYTWRDLGAYDRFTYEQTASALNGTYLAPLQGQAQVLDTELCIIQGANRATFEKQNAVIEALQELIQRQDALLMECYAALVTQYVATGSGALLLTRIDKQRKHITQLLGEEQEVKE